VSSYPSGRHLNAASDARRANEHDQIEHKGDHDGVKRHADLLDSEQPRVVLVGFGDLLWLKSNVEYKVRVANIADLVHIDNDADEMRNERQNREC